MHIVRVSGLVSESLLWWKVAWGRSLLEVFIQCNSVGSSSWPLIPRNIEARTESIKEDASIFMLCSATSNTNQQCFKFNKPTKLWNILIPPGDQSIEPLCWNWTPVRFSFPLHSPWAAVGGPASGGRLCQANRKHRPELFDEVIQGFLLGTSKTSTSILATWVLECFL
jgi:hypothetical protein